MKKYLILSLLIATGCHKIKSVYHVDTDHMACIKFAILNPETLTIGNPQTLPLTECNGVTGFSAEDLPYAVSKAKETIKKAKECDE